MAVFNIGIWSALLVILASTLAATVAEGPDFLTPFFEGLFAATWQSQFKLDFALYLALSGLWIAWRGRFARQAVVMGLLAAILGMMVFAPYLLAVVSRARGDLRRVLLGRQIGDLAPQS